jgi:hypothetical protein
MVASQPQADSVGFLSSIGRRGLSSKGIGRFATLSGPSAHCDIVLQLPRRPFHLLIWPYKPATLEKSWTNRMLKD